jgi:hypothetical protein
MQIRELDKANKSYHENAPAVLGDLSQAEQMTAAGYDSAGRCARAAASHAPRGSV